MNPEHNSSQNFPTDIVTPWKEIFQSSTTRELISVIRVHGWLPVLVSLTLHGLARGVFEHVTDPFAITRNYIFNGWLLPFGVNVYYGMSIVVFAWFMYFGLVGAIAGIFSDQHTLSLDTFKAGGYIFALFVPIFLIGAGIMTTINMPELVASNGRDFASTDAAHMQSVVYDTTQMFMVRVLRSIGWILTGAILLPLVSEIYEIDEVQSLIAVVPMTIVAIVSSFLL